MSQPGKPNFQAEQTVCDAHRNAVYTPDGKPTKEKINMTGGKFHDGSPQSFYFPEGHIHGGCFKGMVIILEEHGYAYAQHLHAQCKDFKCLKIFEPQQPCCCQRLLYNELDFRSVVSLVKQECSQCNFEVLFLPKFHCELNFIEQCWGYAKWVYREFPPSKSDTEMEGYVMKALSSVKVETMRRLVFHFECWIHFVTESRSGSSIERFDSWMPIAVGLQGHRPLGQVDDIEAIANYLIWLCTNLTMWDLAQAHLNKKLIIYRYS